MIRLSIRMEAIARLVPKGGPVWDVGCDHGYIPIYLVQQGVVDRAYATDLRPGPLERARENIEACRLKDKIRVALSDGLKAGDGFNADTLIVAGMGGPLTVRLLTEAADKVRAIPHLILQPQSHIGDVRAYIREQGFGITREDMVLDEGKYYQMMLVDTKGPADTSHGIQGSFAESLSSSQLEWAEDNWGPLLIKEKHPILYERLQKEYKKTSDIIRKLEGNDRNLKKTLQLREELYILEQLLRFFRTPRDKSPRPSL